jgi:hypothetical protein
MTKEEFIQQYILNRANTVVENIDALSSAQKALKVWNEIQKPEYKQGRP